MMEDWNGDTWGYKEGGEDGVHTVHTVHIS